MKFYLKADLRFEAEDLYAACQRLRLHFADCAGALARGEPMPGALWANGVFEIAQDGPKLVEPAKKK